MCVACILSGRNVISECVFVANMIQPVDHFMFVCLQKFLVSITLQNGLASPGATMVTRFNYLELQSVKDVPESKLLGSFFV